MCVVATPKEDDDDDEEALASVRFLATATRFSSLPCCCCFLARRRFSFGALDGKFRHLCSAPFSTSAPASFADSRRAMSSMRACIFLRPSVGHEA